MNDLIEAVRARIKTPYFGYAVLAFLALNWRGIFLLATTTGSPEVRLSAFDSVTNHYTLLIFPLFVGAVVAALTSWIQYLFEWISRKPLELIENIHLEASHKKTIKQAQLEESRSKLFAVKEIELIDRAKRDEVIANIEDEATKQKIMSQIDSIRQERDRLSEQLKNQAIDDINNISKEAVELIKAASESDNGTIINIKSSDRSIQAGNQSFGSDNSRNFAKYDAALNELLNKNLVKALGVKGEVFELTNIGWQLADAL